MIIRCPTCTTQFRIQPEHLNAAAGQVRCGRCAEVFEAQRYVVSLGPPIVPIPPLPMPQPKPRSLRPGRLWRLGSWLLLIALPLQWAWWERAALAEDKDLASIVAKICERISCELPPFYAREFIDVLDRSLEPDPNRPNISQFRFRMVNKAIRAQSFPFLDIKLTNTNSEIIGIRRFTPKEYLPTNIPPTSMMQPGEPIQASLDLLNPNGEDTTGMFEIYFR